MTLLEDLLVGLLYLPFLLAPFALLFWYAFAANRPNEAEVVKKSDDRSQRPARKADAELVFPDGFQRRFH